MKNPLFQLIFFSVLFFANIVCAQEYSPLFNLGDTTQIHFVQTKSEEVYIGKVKRVESKAVQFESATLGEIKFVFSEINKIGVKGDELWKSIYTATVDETKSDSTTTIKESFVSYQDQKRNFKAWKRLHRTKDNRFHQPIKMLHYYTAFPMKKGTGFYQNLYLLYNEVTYGITDQLVVGTSVFFPIIGAIQMRLNYPLTHKLHTALALQAGGTIYNGGASASQVYGIVTYGTPSFYVNTTGGVLFVRDEYYFSDEKEGYAELTFSLGLGGGTERTHYKFNPMFRLDQLGELKYSMLMSIGYYNNNKEYEWGVVPGNILSIDTDTFIFFPFFSYKSYF